MHRTNTDKALHQKVKRHLMTFNDVEEKHFHEKIYHIFFCISGSKSRIGKEER